METRGRRSEWHDWSQAGGQVAERGVMGIWWVRKVGAKETGSLQEVIGECVPLTSVERGNAGSSSLCAAYASTRGGMKALGRLQRGSRGQKNQCKVSLKGKKEEYQGKHPAFQQEVT